MIDDSVKSFQHIATTWANKKSAWSWYSNCNYGWAFVFFMWIKIKSKYPQIEPKLADSVIVYVKKQ